MYGIFPYMYHQYQPNVGKYNMPYMDGMGNVRSIEDALVKMFITRWFFFDFPQNGGDWIQGILSPKKGRKHFRFRKHGPRWFFFLNFVYLENIVFPIFLGNCGWF